MKFFNYLLLSLVAFQLGSCQQEDSTFKLNSTEEAAREIGFVSINNQQVIETRTAGLMDMNNVIKSLNVIARIARPSTDCKSGIGLCDFRTSESDISYLLQPRPAENNHGICECTTVCQLDSTMNGIAYFLLAARPETQGLTTNTMPPFYVEAEIEQPLEHNSNGLLIVPAGVYYFNPSLGNYGGYAINMTYVQE